MHTCALRAVFNGMKKSTLFVRRPDLVPGRYESGLNLHCGALGGL